MQASCELQKSAKDGLSSVLDGAGRRLGDLAARLSDLVRCSGFCNSCSVRFGLKQASDCAMENSSSFSRSRLTKDSFQESSRPHSNSACAVSASTAAALHAEVAAIETLGGLLLQTKLLCLHGPTLHAKSLLPNSGSTECVRYRTPTVTCHSQTIAPARCAVP